MRLSHIIAIANGLDPAEVSSPPRRALGTGLREVFDRTRVVTDTSTSNAGHRIAPSPDQSLEIGRLRETIRLQEIALHHYRAMAARPIRETDRYRQLCDRVERQALRLDRNPPVRMITWLKPIARLVTLRWWPVGKPDKLPARRY